MSADRELWLATRVPVGRQRTYEQILERRAKKAARKADLYADNPPAVTVSDDVEPTGGRKVRAKKEPQRPGVAPQAYTLCLVWVRGQGRCNQWALDVNDLCGDHSGLLFEVCPAGTKNAGPCRAKPLPGLIWCHKHTRRRP